MKHKAISQRNTSKSGCGRTFVIAFGFVFCCFGIFFIWITAVAPYLNSQAASSWSSTPCKILSSKVETHTDDEGDTSYSPDIKFEYNVDGTKFSGDRYSFSIMSGSSKSAHEIVKEYRAGTESVCYFDPMDPSQSVLDREFDTTLVWMSLFPLLFVVIGAVAITAGALGWGFDGHKKKRAAISGKSSSSKSGGAKSAFHLLGATVNANVADQLDDEWSLPMKLKSKESRWIALLVVFAVATFWNGIVSIFVIALVFDSPGFWPRIGMGLFLTPFVLVGLVMIFACLYMFLKLFTPRVEVAFSTGAVPLGGEVDIAWEVFGRTSRLRNLKLAIQGEQSATYRRGTDTRTDTEVFELIPIGEVSTHDEIRFGSATVRIPASTMHTHIGHNNQITWSVVVRGEIKWWPDLFESFEFRVKPAPAKVA